MVRNIWRCFLQAGETLLGVFGYDLGKIGDEVLYSERQLKLSCFWLFIRWSALIEYVVLIMSSVSDSELEL